VVVLVLVLAVVGLPLHSLPRDLVVVSCSTRCPPCEQLLAAVEAGARLSVNGVGVGVSSSFTPSSSPLWPSSPVFTIRSWSGRGCWVVRALGPSLPRGHRCPLPPREQLLTAVDVVPSPSLLLPVSTPRAVARGGGSGCCVILVVAAVVWGSLCRYNTVTTYKNENIS
jgi:hypothetical protein